MFGAHSVTCLLLIEWLFSALTNDCSGPTYMHTCALISLQNCIMHAHFCIQIPPSNFWMNAYCLWKSNIWCQYHDDGMINQKCIGILLSYLRSSINSNSFLRRPDVAHTIWDWSFRIVAELPQLCLGTCSGILCIHIHILNLYILRFYTLVIVKRYTERVLPICEQILFHRQYCIVTNRRQDHPQRWKETHVSMMMRYHLQSVTPICQWVSNAFSYRIFRACNLVSSLK